MEDASGWSQIPAWKKVKEKQGSQRDELISLACDRLKSEETEYNEMAKAWAIELAKIAALQQLFAKRAINDILFEGQLDTQHHDPVVINASVSRACTPSSSMTASNISCIHDFTFTHLDDQHNQQPSVSTYFLNFQ